MKRLNILFALMLSCAFAYAGPRESENFDAGWKFALGDASSLMADFGYGTEYFNYWTKAASIHNEGPYSLNFEPEKWGREWVDVTLPHDWVVDLPFAAEASHSHGYKTVGPTYPKTSVGWYRKEFTVPASDEGRSISLRFDGVFHSSQVWVNGFYLGREDDGYVSSEYDISQYLLYGENNVVAVRVDASQESGWFYEGAGIYRHVWLNKTSAVHIAPDGVFVQVLPEKLNPAKGARVKLNLEIENCGLKDAKGIEIKCEILDASGKTVASRETALNALILPYSKLDASLVLDMEQPHVWSVDDPYLHTAVTSVYCNGQLVDVQKTRFGVRTAVFTSDQGFLLNGERVQLKGVNLHQDHAGVGSAITDELYEYRLERLRSFGCNAIRSSHNPMAPAFLDLCDSLGFLVIDENRLMGTNEYHRSHLERMIKRDRNHPSVIAWSVGNEEWGIEWKEWGSKLTAVMREFCHRLDPTRQMTVATSSGPNIVETADVAGYNYIIQNDVEGLRAKYPDRKAMGTEETTGCGTRGWYFADPTGAHMPAINRGKQGPDSTYNCIERGWKFYHQRPYLGGLFYWTGFDYRGESNPLVFPATGSSFGLLDYCGFYKDEAWYLKAWWTDETVLHLLPHWNLKGHEGEKVSIWAYSNCDQVELFVNGRSMGRKAMPVDGHLEWEAVYNPGRLKAVGYKKGKAVKTVVVNTADIASQISVQQFVRPAMAVLDMTLFDKKGNFAADACPEVSVTVQGPAYVMGVGNGDSGWQDSERPLSAVSRLNACDGGASAHSFKSFNGCAQLILGSAGDAFGKGQVTVTINVQGCPAKTIVL